MLDKKIIRQHFNDATESYDAVAVLQQEVANRLSERLAYIKIDPKITLDMGCGTGFISKDLLQRYSKSKVVSLDSALNMTRKCLKQGGWFRKPSGVCADAEALPIKPDTVDLIVSNLMLQWCNDLEKTFSGFHQVLAPNGLLLFSTLGPDTLKEVRQSWQSVDEEPHTSPFMDMHDIGDALLKAGFIDPVTDMEVITMTYSGARQLMTDIKKTGANNAHSQRTKGLTGKHKFAEFENNYQKFITDEGLFPATWEIIYGHAWVGEGLKLDNYEKVIPIKEIRP
ncbi:MAG: malonyl-ACP O-methyltransferase BioC [Cocleimonas sp.]